MTVDRIYYKYDFETGMVYEVDESIDSNIILVEDLVSYTVKYIEGTWKVADGLDASGCFGHLAKTVAYKRFLK